MLKPLVGSWKVVCCQLHGKWLPEPIFKEFRYNMTDKGTFELDWAEVTFPQYVGGFPKSKTGKIVLNLDTTPKQMDFIPAEGPFANKALQGIFELDHDLLKAIFSFPGTARPTQFSAGQGQVYEVWQRT